MKIFGYLALFFSLILPVTAQTLNAETERQIEIQSAKLNSADMETRRDGVFRLGLLQNAVASKVASHALKDSSEIVRATAVRAVVYMSAEDAVRVLIPLLSDKSEFVRRETAYALGETFSKDATGNLIRVLQMDKYPSVRAAAAIALGNISDEDAIESLTQILLAPQTKQNRTIDEFVRRSAARSLGQIRHKRAVPALIQVLRDTTNADDIRREAAAALGLIADKSAVDVLRAQLNAEDYILSQIALEALQKIESSTDSQR